MEHPFLWLSADQLPTWRQRCWTGELAPVAGAVLAAGERYLAVETAMPESGQDWPGHDRLVAAEVLATAFLLTERVELAAAAATALRAGLRDRELQDLGKARQSQAAAFVYDGCYPGWGEEARKAGAADLVRLARAHTTCSSHNPDQPFNNWWGVTHASYGLAALAVHREEPSVEADLELACSRVRTYLTNYGEGGHYYEGTGYGLYAFSHWGPFLLACRQVLGRDLADLSPGIGRWPVLVHGLTAERENPPSPDRPEGSRGLRLFWNDESGHYPVAGWAALLLRLAPAPEQAGLKTLFQRLCGEAGDRSWREAKNALHWVLLQYPESVAGADPEATLPRHLVDLRTGLAVFRSGYSGPDDGLAALYARTYHGGGHSHEDAGSFRLYGFGSAWSQAGGQAKPQPEFQTVILPEGGLKRHLPSRLRNGQISYLDPERDGSGAVSLRLSHVHGSKLSERHFAVRWMRRTDLCLVAGLWDYLWAEEEQDWTWTWCHEDGLQFVPWPEENGFFLRQPTGAASLAVRFPGLQRLDFRHQRGQPTERTYSNGVHKSYPGACFVSATVRAEKILLPAVLTVQRGDPPELDLRGAGEDLQVVCAGWELHLRRNRWFVGPLVMRKNPPENFPHETP